MIDDIDERIRHALVENAPQIDQYEAELFRDEPPFRIHSQPDRIKWRLRVLRDLSEERADALREMKRGGQP